MILAPGAGSDLRTPLLVAVHDGLAAAGILGVRFNFPYKERGGRAPDPAPVLERCYEAVVEQVRDRWRPRRVIIGGKSMGGRMASHLAARDVPLDGLMLLGYPLHPAGKPTQLRSAHLPRIRVPVLFVAGTRDPLCPLPLLEQTISTLTAAVTLHAIPDGDHSFAVPRRTGRTRDDVYRDIAATCVEWVRRI